MNFGQYWRSPAVVEASYRLVVPLTYVASFVDQRLDEWIDDAQRFPQDRTSFEVELAKRNWPGQKSILADTLLLSRLVAELDYDFLLHVLDKKTQDQDFVLNTVDHRELKSQSLVLAGRGRHPDLNLSFQDW